MASGREFGTIRVETIDAPIILVEFSEKNSEEDLRGTLGYLEELMREALKSHRKLFFVTDISRMRVSPPARQRQYTAEWSKTNAALSRASSLGGATVAPSAILRGIITAVFWLFPSPTPTWSMATRHEAMLKGIELLTEQKIALSPRLLAYRDLRAAR